MTDRRPIVDPRRVACLGGGSHAVVAITPDGDTSLWIIGPDPDDEREGCACADHAPHEQDGPLPAIYRHRLGSTYDYPCCGAPTRTTGRPCRYPVARPGDRCHHHQEETQP